MFGEELLDFSRHGGRERYSKAGGTNGKSLVGLSGG
jgi:hypothetical protein